tara:strand:+ start:2776 stop:3321 length:546 start_codon:yes stop_codon:yes gene_type:complete
MAQIVNIRLTSAGNCAGPCDLYSDADGFAVPFETGISITVLTSALGYNTTNVPPGATVINIQNNNIACGTNGISVPIATSAANVRGYYSPANGGTIPYSSSTDGCAQTDTPNTEWWWNSSLPLSLPPAGALLYDGPDPATANLLSLAPGYYPSSSLPNVQRQTMIQVASNGYEVLSTTLCP